MTHYQRITILVPTDAGSFSSDSDKAQRIAAEWLAALQADDNSGLYAADAVIKAEGLPGLLALSEPGIFYEQASRQHRETTGETTMIANAEFGEHAIFAPPPPRRDDSLRELFTFPRASRQESAQ